MLGQGQSFFGGNLRHDPALLSIHRSNMIDPYTKQWINHQSVSQLIHTAINGSINQSVNELIYTPNNGSINQSVSQPVSPSTNHSTNQSINMRFFGSGAHQGNQQTITGNQHTPSTECSKVVNMMTNFCSEPPCVSHSLWFDCWTPWHCRHALTYADAACWAACRHCSAELAK